MSSESVRRSTREAEYAGPLRCPDCRKQRHAYDTQATSETHRCPDCFKYNDNDYVFAAFCDAIRLNNCIYCICMCRCIDTDSKDDANYEPLSENEDPEDNELVEVDPVTEDALARRPGWQTIAIGNANAEDERRYYYEGPAHAAIAAAYNPHDPSTRAESSTYNAENHISTEEVGLLPLDLQPWEARNMAEDDPIRTWNDLAETFPEMHDMGRIDPATQVAPPPAPICRLCGKPASDGWMEWNANGGVTTCEFCGLTRRPSSSAEDPDWHNYTYGAPGTMTTCHCRCRCSRNPSEEDAMDVDDDHHGPEHHMTDRNGQAGDGDTQPLRLPLPHLPFIVDLEYNEDGTYRGFGHGQRAFANLRDAVAFGFELPSVRISENRNAETGLYENVDWALQDCWTAIHTEQYEMALRYNQLGLQMGRFWASFGAEHHLMAGLLAACEHLEQFFEELIDNCVFYLDISQVHSVQSSNSIHNDRGIVDIDDISGISTDYGDPGRDQENRHLGQGH